jgi:hypothetical protein
VGTREDRTGEWHASHHSNTAAPLRQHFNEIHIRYRQDQQVSARPAARCLNTARAAAARRIGETGSAVATTARSDGFLRGELGDPPGGWPEPLRTKAFDGRPPAKLQRDLSAADEATLAMPGPERRATLNRLLIPGGKTSGKKRLIAAPVSAKC